MRQFGIGQPVRRVEDRRFLTGGGRYLEGSDYLRLAKGLGAHTAMMKPFTWQQLKEAIEVASRLIRDIGYEPVLIGGLEMGRHLMPGTAYAGEHTAEEIRKIRVE